MTKEEMYEVFRESCAVIRKDEELVERKEKAEESILNLQDEWETLKEKRPKMLAEGKSVIRLNKRLEKIEEDIELYRETITGVEEKRKEIENDIYQAKMDYQEAFQKYVKEIMNQVKAEYMELAPKLATVINDYLSLEYIYYGNDRCYPSAIEKSDIARLPNLNNTNKSLFQHDFYHFCVTRNDEVRKKFDIPDYQVHKIRY